MTAQLHYESLTTVSGLRRRRKLSPVELTEAMPARIDQLDGRHQAFVTVTAERARARAKTAEAEIARGLWRGPLHGVPIAVKDLANTSFAPTASGTTILRDYRPDFDATVVSRLNQAGAVILGKLRMTEGAYTSHHPELPTPLNPWSVHYWVGSSSTGSGVATSLGLCFGSLGSDTGGSIRFPSATCGLTGVKPTWSRVSRYGVFPLAESLDHVGPTTRNARDGAAMLGILAGPDVNDPTTYPVVPPDDLDTLGKGVRGLRIGVDWSYATDGADASVAAAHESAARTFEDLHAVLREVNSPTYKKLVSRWIAMCSVETAAAHRATYPAPKSEYGTDLAALIDQGHATSGVQIAGILMERMVFSRQLATLFERVDVLLIPTMPVPISSLNQMKAYGEDPAALLGILRFIAPFNVSDSPTVTPPNGADPSGLPLSMQIVGPHLSEGRLVRASQAFQSVTDWHRRRLPVV